MSLVETVDRYSTPLLTVLGILAIVVPVYLRWARPKWRAFRRDIAAGRDALVGRDAIVDPVSGTQLAPALPGVGKRMETIEAALVVLADNQTVIRDHEDRLVALEKAAVERIVARAETGAAFSAMEAAIRASPDPDTSTDPSPHAAPSPDRTLP